MNQNWYQELLKGQPSVESGRGRGTTLTPLSSLKDDGFEVLNTYGLVGNHLQRGLAPNDKLLTGSGEDDGQDLYQSIPDGVSVIARDVSESILNPEPPKVSEHFGTQESQSTFAPTVEEMYEFLGPYPEPRPYPEAPHVDPSFFNGVDLDIGPEQ